MNKSRLISAIYGVSMALDTGYSIPTLSTLVESATAKIQTDASWLYPHIPGSLGWVLARLIAVLSWGLYQYGGYLARQILPDTATDGNLERHSAIHGITRVAATKSTGVVVATGTNTTVIPVGTRFQRADGALYVCTVEATIALGEADVDVEALVAGEDGDTAADVTLSVISPPVGLDGTVTVGDDGLVGGTDTEGDDSLRERLLLHLATPPAAGTESDYIAWAQAALSTVDQVWVYPQGYGPGTVGVVFTVDGADPIPDAGDIDTVQDYIDSKAPITAAVTVTTPDTQEIDIEFSELGIESGAVLADVKDAIEVEIAGYFATVEPGALVRLSKLGAAVSAAEGEDYHTIIDPAGDVDLPDNTIPILGTITWP